VVSDTGTSVGVRNPEVKSRFMRKRRLTIICVRRREGEVGRQSRSGPALRRLFVFVHLERLFHFGCLPASVSAGFCCPDWSARSQNALVTLRFLPSAKKEPHEQGNGDGPTDANDLTDESVLHRYGTEWRLHFLGNLHPYIKEVALSTHRADDGSRVGMR
jgi:hypothetical protein